MIWRTSVSEEKHSTRSTSSAHTDSVTLLDDQAEHLAAHPNVTSKTMNRSSRAWATSGFDRRLIWLVAFVLYAVVLLAAYITTYRHQYQSIVVTTSYEPAEPDEDGRLLPQLLLLASPAEGDPTAFGPLKLGLAMGSSALSFDTSTSWCDGNPDSMSLNVTTSPGLAGYKGWLFNYTSCFDNGQNDPHLQGIHIVAGYMKVLAALSPPSQLFLGVFPPDRDQPSIIEGATTPADMYALPVNVRSQAGIWLTPSRHIDLEGVSTSRYDIRVEWSPVDDSDDFFGPISSSTTTSFSASSTSSFSDTTAIGSTSPTHPSVSSYSHSSSTSIATYTTPSPTPQKRRRKGLPRDWDHEQFGPTMTILVKYAAQIQTVTTESRRLSASDIFCNALALLAVPIFAVQLLEHVGQWWFRRQMSRKLRID